MNGPVEFLDSNGNPMEIGKYYSINNIFLLGRVIKYY